MKSRYKPDRLPRKEMNDDSYKWGLFYYNPYDTRVIVPKRAPWMGWTLNFANLWTYAILGAIIVIAILVETLN